MGDGVAGDWEPCKQGSSNIGSGVAALERYGTPGPSRIKALQQHFDLAALLETICHNHAALVAEASKLD